MKPIDLDQNATTPLDPEVAQRMIEAARDFPANPASQHQLGRRARYAIEQAAETIAQRLGLHHEQTPADRVIFTSGGTEANNMALLGLTPPTPGRVVLSAIEHPSSMAAGHELIRRGWQVDLIRVGSSGIVDLAHLQELLHQPGPPPQLVSLMLVNHETGVIQPVAEAAQMCREVGVPLHTDAAQAIGKIDVDFRSLGVAAMTVVPHKFHGPVGIGGLMTRAGTTIRPTLFGGGQQLGARPGTESVALSIGFAASLDQLQRTKNTHNSHITHLRNQWEETVLRLDEAVMVNGGEPRVGSTSNLSFVGRDRQALWMGLDRVGVCCSAGSACASGSSERSPVLTAMGLGDARIESGLRFSLGSQTTAWEIGEAIDRLTTVLTRMGRLARRG